MFSLLSKNLVLRIQLTLSLFIVLTALSISLLWYHSYEQDHRLTIEKLYHYSSETIYSQLESFFSKAQEVYQHQEVIQDQLPEIATDREKLLTYLTSALDHHESIDYFYFANTQGGLLSLGQKQKRHFTQFESESGQAGPLLSYQNLRNGNTNKLLNRVEHFDARNRQWYKNALDTDAPVWSDLYPGVVNNNMLGITLSKVLRDKNNQVVGVWGVDLTLSSIETALHNAKPSLNSTVALIDNNGNILASSDPKHQANHGLLINAISEQSPVLNQLWPVINQEDQIHSSIQSFSYNGEHWLNSHTHFPLNNNRSVTIVIYSPESDFTKDLLQTKHYAMVIAALIIIFAIYYGTLRTERILTPIRQLTKASEEISQGKWLQQINAEHDDEVGKLALSFNKMAIHLEATISQLDRQKQETERLNQKLEERVRARTEELSAANARLRQLADSDPLTGIANQRHFWEVFTKRTKENSGWLLILDIDDFKKLNDTFGHVIGDQALKHFTRVCETCLANRDFMGRIGGEEFAIWSEVNEIHALTKRILLTLKQSPLHVNGKQIQLSVSIGGTDCSPNKVNGYAIADKMLYQAKLAGKNRAIIDSSANTTEASYISRE